MLSKLNIKIGAQPIMWSSDDFQNLGGDIPLKQCLKEMRAAGYSGTEVGHKFPRSPAKLKTLLKKYDLSLVSGWHSTYLASRGFDEEKQRFKEQLEFLSQMGCPMAIVAECTGRVYNDPQKPLHSSKPALNDRGWERLTGGLEEFAKMAALRGILLVYHHHMGTVVQDLNDINRLMAAAKSVHLLADTGHMAFAGMEPLEVFENHKDRIAHVHLKNIRPEIVEESKKRDFSFETAVKRGVFTIPGDAGIDYLPIFKVLSEKKYGGWMVVEAEQDPAKANPLEYARMAREYIKKTTGL